MKSRCLFILSWALSVLAGCSGNGVKSDAYGNFEAKETLISSESAGRVLRLSASEGMELAAGDTACIIDTVQVYLQKEQVRAQVLAARAQIQSAEQRFEASSQKLTNLQKEKERIERLRRDKAATQKQWDDITGEEKVLQKTLAAGSLDIDAAREKAAAAQKNLDLLLDRLKRCYVVNPIAGTVLETYVEEHELTSPGRPLYTIAPLTSMILKVYVSGAQLPHIGLGDSVAVRIDENETENRELAGVVSWIASKAEFTPKTIQTKEERVNEVYEVKIRVQNDGSLKIGMPGEAVFRHGH